LGNEGLRVRGARGLGSDIGPSVAVAGELAASPSTGAALATTARRRTGFSVAAASSGGIVSRVVAGGVRLRGVFGRSESSMGSSLARNPCVGTSAMLAS